jgi:cyclic pyranopterin phosphate synthase
LLRKNVEILIAQLSELRTLDGKPLDLTLTTNASLLKKKAQSLKDAGLKRLTISLDAMDDAIFRQMNDMDFPVADVLDGIAMASQVGFEDIKVNMVVKRGTNEDQILPMAAHFRGTGVSLRFIEYMDVGASNGWRMDEVLPTADVLSLLQSRWPLQALPPKSVGETATRYGYLNAQGALDPQLGEVGFISSVTQAFCQDCNRARLSTDGRLFNCLFATEGANVRDLLRGAPDGGVDTVAQYLAYLWQQRTDQYSALRQAGMVPAGNAERRVEMSFIGG